jgi:hypothetical protein
MRKRQKLCIASPKCFGLPPEEISIKISPGPDNEILQLKAKFHATSNIM